MRSVPGWLDDEVQFVMKEDDEETRECCEEEAEEESVEELDGDFPA